MSRTEYLLGNQSFSDDELNKIESALGKANLRNYERIGNRLKIPTNEKATYVKALADGGALPATHGT